MQVDHTVSNMVQIATKNSCNGCVHALLIIAIFNRPVQRSEERWQIQRIRSRRDSRFARRELGEFAQLTLVGLWGNVEEWNCIALLMTVYREHARFEQCSLA